MKQRDLYAETDLTTMLEGYPSVWSECRAYRYVLWRSWFDKGSYETEAFVQFVGLNPSTADDVQDDPTIRRCIGFAKRWGYGAMCMTNLFAFRATNPAAMKRQADPVGPDNNHWLQHIALDASEVVGCWGAHGKHRQRDAEVYKLLPELKCFGCNADGSPRHPLYLPKDTDLEGWSVTAT